MLACGDSLHTTHRTLSDQCNTCEFNIAGVLRCRVWAQSTLFCGRARRTGSPLLPNASLQHAQSVSFRSQDFKTLDKTPHCVSRSSSAPIKWEREVIKGLIDSQQAQNCRKWCLWQSKAADSLTLQETDRPAGSGRPGCTQAAESHKCSQTSSRHQWSTESSGIAWLRCPSSALR